MRVVRETCDIGNPFSTCMEGQKTTKCIIVNVCFFVMQPGPERTKQKRNKNQLDMLLKSPSDDATKLLNADFFVPDFGADLVFLVRWYPENTVLTLPVY